MEQQKKVIISFLGMNGNAFVLMANWRKAARQQGWKDEEIEAVLTEAQSSDYNHLLKTLMDNSQEPEHKPEELDRWI